MSTDQTADPMVQAILAAIRHVPLIGGDGLCVWLDEGFHADVTLNMVHGPEAGRAEADAMLDANLLRIAEAAAGAVRGVA